MSTNEFAEGSWLLPAKEFPKLKQALVAAWNAEITRQYDFALKLHEEIVQAGAGQRGFDYRRAAEDAWQRAIHQRLDASVGLGPFRRPTRTWTPGDDAFLRAIGALFLDPKTRRSRSKPVKPKKKDYPFANGATTSFDAFDFAIWLDPARRLVGWSVPQNNHAVQRAQDHPATAVLFRLLSEVRWTRGSGGSARYRSEYDWDSSLRHGFGPTRETPLPAAERHAPIFTGAAR